MISYLRKLHVHACKAGNTRFPLLRFRSALRCGYSGITDIQDGLLSVIRGIFNWELSDR